VTNGLEKVSCRIGYWSAIVIALLVVLIDSGMILEAILFPLTTITSIESYAASFTSWQMLPFIPSLILAPMFVILMLSIEYYAPEGKKIFSQLGCSFGTVCAAILGIHYYIQLTVVQQGLLNNETSGLWLLATPNPHSLFWSLSALGYGFMGFALLSVAYVFNRKSERNIRLLLAVNGLTGIVFLVGNALGIFLVNILASFIWGVLFPIACILMAKTFKQATKLS
jgi:hypothetical protein